MESKRLLECLEADYTRLREVVQGADLTAVVPTCPDWTVDDLVRHVGTVYLHKVECMRLGTHPDPWPPPALAEEESRGLLDRGYTALSAEFSARAAESPAFTWYGPDQTVGFWIRRMAHETVIHRVDAEFGAGVATAPIPADLAHDGIDEFLFAFVEYDTTTWAEDYTELLGPADGRSVRVETPDAAWLITLTPEGVPVRRSDVDGANAVVRGEPADLLLWLWNRADDEVVTASGDPDLPAYLRKVLAASAG